MERLVITYGDHTIVDTDVASLTWDDFQGGGSVKWSINGKTAGGGLLGSILSAGLGQSDRTARRQQRPAEAAIDAPADEDEVA